MPAYCLDQLQLAYYLYLGATHDRRGRYKNYYLQTSLYILHYMLKYILYCPEDFMSRNEKTVCKYPHHGTELDNISVEHLLCPFLDESEAIIFPMTWEPQTCAWLITSDSSHRYGHLNIWAPGDENCSWSVDSRLPASAVSLRIAETTCVCGAQWFRE